MENKELYLYLKELVKRYPNDQELGRALRNYVFILDDRGSFEPDPLENIKRGIGETILSAIKKVRGNEK